MAESIDRDNLPQATVVPKRGTRISIVWIIPILAAVVAIGIAVQRVLSEGPTITSSSRPRRALRPARPSSSTRT